MKTDAPEQGGAENKNPTAHWLNRDKNVTDVSTIS